MSTITTPASIKDGLKSQGFRWDLRKCAPGDRQLTPITDGEGRVVGHKAPEGAVKRVYIEQTLVNNRETSRVIYGPDGETLFQWDCGRPWTDEDTNAQSNAADPKRWGHA